MYSRYLKTKRCEVFVAPDGAIAIEKAAWLCPDVIVMDLAMPRVDGWTATARLKASSWTRRIPVIVLSAVELSGDAARTAGCDVFLTKPCTPDALWEQIQAVLERRTKC
jgi:CheY-like chemotaxis protein